jgi:hypothetical protein
MAAQRQHAPVREIFNPLKTGSLSFPMGVALPLLTGIPILGRGPFMTFFWRSLLEGGDFPAGIFLLVAAVIVIVALINDDDLPGPRRCFARMGGPKPRPFALQS